MPKEAKKREMCGESDMIELQESYDAILRRMDEIPSYLNTYDLEMSSPESSTLIYACMALAGVSPAIELYK